MSNIFFVWPAVGAEIVKKFRIVNILPIEIIDPFFSMQTDYKK